MPVGLILLPQLPVANIIGSLKIPAFTGTAFAAYQYQKEVVFNLKKIAVMMAVAFTCSFCGSLLLSKMHNDFMKPLLLIVLSLVALYTFLNKGFGKQLKAHSIGNTQKKVYALLISSIIGFYDGFIGPGAGSFFVMAFIALLGYDFLRASAHAKLLNLATNGGSIVLFLIKGKIIWAIAIPMAVCNAAGAWLGAKLAIYKGNGFIRMFFLIVIIGTLLRFGYDVWFH